MCIFTYSTYIYTYNLVSVFFLQGYSAGSSLPCAAKNLVRTVHGDDTTSEGFLSGFGGRMRVWDGSPSGRNRATPHMKCYFAYYCSPQPHHEHSEKTRLPFDSFNMVLH